MSSVDDSTVDAVLSMAGLALDLGKVQRATLHQDGVTPESDTTHTAMLGLLAVGLAQQWYGPHPFRIVLDPGWVAQYALVHDLPEAIAGDVPTYRITKRLAESKERRERSARMDIGDRFMNELSHVPALISLYENQIDPEARFVKALDKILPKICAILNEGASLRSMGTDRVELLRRHRKQVAQVREYAWEFTELFDLWDSIFNRMMKVAPERKTS